MSEFMHNVQTRIRTGSASLVVYFFKVLTGLFVGLCAALISQTIVGFGDFLFWFVIVLAAAVFLRVSRDWGAWSVAIFNFVVFLLGLLLKLYIELAPGA